MSAIPLHLQRRFEQRSASRFTHPTASTAPKNVGTKAPAAKTKEKPAGSPGGRVREKASLSQPVDFPRTFCPGSPSLRSSLWHPH
jgi:hypothetical protein